MYLRADVLVLQSRDSGLEAQRLGPLLLDFLQLLALVFSDVSNSDTLAEVSEYAVLCLGHDLSKLNEPIRIAIDNPL